ncbi:sulfite exporter TauE/SafE family protein [Arvimicrobium flavum]|uniref:sulfite exporter TauE/SafE family protein n=1 Tax=Arvimicrobium flavum TaxID=3393320 RepID=UPI00237C1A63|nr:sulfite exporter TauE/SafE family protein [Mesorhizobium shangrilense]
MAILTGVFLVVAVLLTSTLSGVFGMVGGMVLLWLLLLVMPVTTAIAVQGMLQLVANCSRAYFARAWMDWRIIGFSTAGLALAILLLALVSYTPSVAMVSICVGLLPIIVWMPVRRLRLDASRPLHAVACGFISGGLNIGVGVAGPVADVFFVRTDMDRRKVIATKAALQVLSHLAKVVYYSGSLVLLSRTEIVSIGIAAPFAVLGSILGHRILVRLSNEGFRQGTRWLVTVVGAFYFVQGVYLIANG